MLRSENKACAQEVDDHFEEFHRFDKVGKMLEKRKLERLELCVDIINIEFIWGNIIYDND